LKYSITTPRWLTASPASGTVTTSAKTITFTINSKARSLGLGTYTDNIGFQGSEPPHPCPPAQPLHPRLLLHPR
jgi:hypothetical protein